MELSTARRLADLNLRFYTEHAENFGDARPRLAAGVRRVLAGIAPAARVLELGCGDGKVGRALARAGVSDYLGLDASEAMLERARRLTRGLTKEERRLPHCEDVGDFAAGDVSTAPSLSGDVPTGTEPAPPTFRWADLMDPGWSGALPDEPFDWILAFAVFHHLPGRALRVAALRTLAERLAPGGRVVLSNWQFTRSERLMRRIVPWAQAGLGEADVEPGDYLLSWERKGTRGLRYVHLLDPAEMARTAPEAGLRVIETFSADGVTDDLSEYFFMVNC